MQQHNHANHRGKCLRRPCASAHACACGRPTLLWAVLNARRAGPAIRPPCCSAACCLLAGPAALQRWRLLGCRSVWRGRAGGPCMGQAGLLVPMAASAAHVAPGGRERRRGCPAPLPLSAAAPGAARSAAGSPSQPAQPPAATTEQAPAQAIEAAPSPPAAGPSLRGARPLPVSGAAGRRQWTRAMTSCRAARRGWAPSWPCSPTPRPPRRRPRSGWAGGKARAGGQGAGELLLQ